MPKIGKTIQKDPWELSLRVSMTSIYLQSTHNVSPKLWVVFSVVWCHTLQGLYSLSGKTSNGWTPKEQHLIWSNPIQILHFAEIKLDGFWIWIIMNPHQLTLCAIRLWEQGVNQCDRALNVWCIAASDAIFLTIYENYRGRSASRMVPRPLFENAMCKISARSGTIYKKRAQLPYHCVEYNRHFFRSTYIFV